MSSAAAALACFTTAAAERRSSKIKSRESSTAAASSRSRRFSASAKALRKSLSALVSIPEMTSSLRVFALASCSFSSLISRADAASFVAAKARASAFAVSSVAESTDGQSPRGASLPTSKLASASKSSLSFRASASRALTDSVAASAAMDAISLRIASENASPSAFAKRNSRSSFSRSFVSRFITLMFARANVVSRLDSSSSFCSISIASTCVRISEFTPLSASISDRTLPSRLRMNVAMALRRDSGNSSELSRSAVFSSPIRPFICASSSLSERASFPASATGDPFPVIFVKFSTSRSRNCSRPVAVTKLPLSLFA